MEHSAVCQLPIGYFTAMIPERWNCYTLFIKCLRTYCISCQGYKFDLYQHLNDEHEVDTPTYLDVCREAWFQASRMEYDVDRPTEHAQMSADALNLYVDFLDATVNRDILDNTDHELLVQMYNNLRTDDGFVDIFELRAMPGPALPEEALEPLDIYLDADAKISPAIAKSKQVQDWLALQERMDRLKKAAGDMEHYRWGIVPGVPDKKFDWDWENSDGDTLDVGVDEEEEGRQPLKRQCEDYYDLDRTDVPYKKCLLE